MPYFACTPKDARSTAFSAGQWTASDRMADLTWERIQRRDRGLYLEVEQAEGGVLDDLVRHVLGEVLDAELELEGGFLLHLAAGRRDMGEGSGLTFWSETFFSMLSQPSRPRESVNCRPKYL